MSALFSAAMSRTIVGYPRILTSFPALAITAQLLVFGCAAVADGEASAAPTVARTQALTAEQVVALRQVSTTAMSPDGRRVAYVLRTPRGADDEPGAARSQIWIVPRGGSDARPLTPPKLSSSSPQWSPDGKALAFLSVRKDQGEKTQVYVLPIDGGESRKLTDSANGVSSFRWSPDGNTIAFSANREQTDQEKQDHEHGRDWVVGDKQGTFKQLFAATVADGNTTEITDGKRSVLAFEWSPDSQQLVVRATDTADTDASYMYSKLYTVGATGGGLTPLCKTAGKLGDMAWSPDGKRIAFLGANDLSDPTAGVVWVAPATGGDATALTADFKGTAQVVEWMDSRTVVFSATQGTRTTLNSVAAGGGPARVLVSDGPICTGIDLAKDRRGFACPASTASHPNEVFVGRLGSRRLRRVTTSNPELAATKLGEQKTIRWKAKDGMEIEGVLIHPVGYQRGKKYPLAVLVHGGPEGVTLDGWLTRAGYPAQMFATRGYVVLQPNYRGSSGRGVAFGKADQKDLGGKEFEDVLAGIDQLVADGLVDEARVGMGGWSYGGYFSALAATQHTKRFRAAMIGAAVTNWISFTGTTDIEDENSLVHWALYPWDEPELAWSRSPMAHTRGSKTAALVVHGQRDERVPPGQGYEIHRALKHAGAATELVLYPREPHGLREAAHQLDFIKRYVQWFDTHVKG